MDVDTYDPEEIVEEDTNLDGSEHDDELITIASSLADRFRDVEFSAVDLDGFDTDEPEEALFQVLQEKRDDLADTPPAIIDREDVEVSVSQSQQELRSVAKSLSRRFGDKVDLSHASQNEPEEAFFQVLQGKHRNAEAKEDLGNCPT
jgi:hypothetical protein